MNASAVTIVTEQPRSLTSVLAHVALVQQVLRDVMQENTHYGASYPGDKKKNLLKPGAEKLCLAFDLVPESSFVQVELPGGHREYTFTIRLRTAQTGQLRAEGYGFGSSMEGKHRWRNDKPKCPDCGQETVIKTARGWWCPPDKGGCGSNPDPKAIESQPRGKVENQNPADCFNTCMKMAHKRALVMATIQATAASDIFTQDAEDMEGKAERSADADARTKQQPPTGPSPTQTGGNAEAKPTPKEQAPAPQTAAPINFDKWSKEGEAVVFKDLKSLVGLAAASACWAAYSKAEERDARFATLKALASACFEIRDKLKEDGVQLISEEVDAHGGKDMKRRAVDSLRDRLVRHSSGEGASNGEIPPGLND